MTNVATGPVWRGKVTFSLRRIRAASSYAGDDFNALDRHGENHGTCHDAKSAEPAGDADVQFSTH
jgi:hypothetical protein